ncbi:MAG TPA: AzlC family ABC transporter permease [Anaerolineales bacterium]|nr:AzlC family ABC transporter permease [Anaerolineales bacterium]
MSSPCSAFLSGLRAELPILPGVVPFGIIYGVAALNAQLPPAAVLAMSSIVFGGSSQFVAVQLIEQGAASFLIVATVFIVNVRHMLYSASVAPYLAHLPRRWKWLLAYLLTDEAYAVIITKYNDASSPTNKHWYHLGAGLALWGTWQISTAVGIALGSQMSEQLETLGLDFAIAVTFIALVVPALRDRAVVAAALSAGILSVVAAALPYNLGLMIAALAGIAAGLIVERKIGSNPLINTIRRE